MKAAATAANAAAPTADERLVLARDPTTPPATLGAIYRAWANDTGGRPAAGREGRDASAAAAAAAYEALGDALAENPNTPLNVLALLATSRTAAFCRNPVAPLLLLEDPDFVLRLQIRQIPALLRDSAAPSALVEAIATQVADAQVREEASLHVAAAGEVADGEWRAELRAMFLDRVLHGMRRLLDRKQLAGMLAVGIAPPWLAVGDLAAGEGAVEAWREPEKAREGVHRSSLSPQAAPLCRCLGLAHPLAGAAVLEAYSASLVWMERLGVALNPHSADLPGALPLLTDDGNRYVRAAARARLRGEEAGL